MTVPRPTLAGGSSGAVIMIASIGEPRSSLLLSPRPDFPCDPRRVPPSLEVTYARIVEQISRGGIIIPRVLKTVTSHRAFCIPLMFTFEKRNTILLIDTDIHWKG